MQENRIIFNWSGRPGCWIPLVAAVPGVLVGLVLLAIAGFQLLQQQGYRSGQCAITAKQLQHEVSTTTSTTGNGNTTTRTTTTQDVYAPFFEYRVRTADGQSYLASGYDGSDTYTSDRATQQAIVDRYSVGQSYPCWYNPVHPTQAVLIRQLNWVLIVVGGIFLLVSLFIATIGLLIARTSTQGAAEGAPLPGLGGSSNGSQNDEAAWQYTPQSSMEYETQEVAEEQPEQQWTDRHEEDWREQ